MTEDISGKGADAQESIRQALEKSEERFRRVIEYSPIAKVMVNAGGQIEMVNAQTERMFGYDRSELLGRPVETLVPERFRHGHSELRSLFFRTPQSRPMGAGQDLYGLRRDGSEFPVEIGLTPIETDEGLCVLSAIVDISSRKQEDARIESALAEKDVLLGEIHHRVKNNLQIVCSLLDLQSARIDDAGVRDMLRDTRNRVRSMALIHQTLYQSNNFAEIDFASFLNTLGASLLSSYGADPEHVTLRIRADAKALPLNTAIPCGLIVNELMANALKHAFSEGSPGAIDIVFEDLAADMARLTVSDNGIGIPETIDVGRTETLGLQLVSLLSDQLQGTLDIQKAEPTRFSLTFRIQNEEPMR